MHSGALPFTAPTPAGPGQESTWLFPGHCQRSSQQPHNGTVGSQKNETLRAQLETTPRAEPGLKRPCSPSTVPAQKDSADLPPPLLLFAPHSKGNTNSFFITKLFTLSESFYKPGNICQKQSSQKCQLRKLLLLKNSIASKDLPVHPLLCEMLVTSKNLVKFVRTLSKT